MNILSYDLSLDVDYAGLRYAGKVRINLEDPPADLTLNQVGLNILSVKGGSGDLGWEDGPDEEEFQVHGLTKEDRFVEIQFEGTVAQEKLIGFYKSQFDGGYLLTTQFEATQARRMFPCLDHPAYKAVFQVNLTIPEALHAVFNTPMLNSAPVPGGKKRIRFHPTPRMSTYLVYFGIGPIAEVERRSGRLRVIVALPKEKRENAGFALDHAAPTVEFFERYFGIPYPLPKLHLISVPDTWVGAMENWGAISFREIALLVDVNTSALIKKQVAVTIAHEIAHQWFGDLVTMAWWNDLWLNESFATFMSYKALEYLHPEWGVWNDFLSESTSRALLWDALVTTHPIEAEIARPVEIDEAFDEISYEKGGAVLRMIESFLGPEHFAKGVSTYLKRYQYANAQSMDLWRTIEEVTAVPIPEIMGAWVRRVGYPLITIRREGSQLVLTQERFLLEGTDAADPWPVPITLSLAGKEQRLLFKDRTLSVDLGTEDPAWVLVNGGRTGYYRVQYSEALGSALHARLADLPEADRWGLVQDTYAALLAGKTDPADYFALIRRLRNDPSTLVAEEIVSELSALAPLFDGLESTEGEVRLFAAAQLQRHGLDSRPDESQSVRALRERLALLQDLFDRSFAGKMDERFPHYGRAEPEVRAAIVVAHALRGGTEAYEEIEKMFLSSPNEGDAWRCSLALACFSQPELLERSLGLVFRPETGLGRAIPLLSSCIAFGSRQELGRVVLRRWMANNLETLNSVMKGSAILSQFLQSFVSRAGLMWFDEMRTFLDQHPLPGAESGKAKGFELLKVYERMRPRFAEFEAALSAAK